jgi:hypothetical protein
VEAFGHNYHPLTYYDCKLIADSIRRDGTLPGYPLNGGSPIWSPYLFIETTLSADLRVLSLSKTAETFFGKIHGRTLMTADWVKDGIDMMREYVAYVYTLNTSLDNQIPSKILCQIFPFRSEVVEGDDAEGRGPNTLLWMLRDAPVVHDYVQIDNVIRSSIRRLVDLSFQRVAEFSAQVVSPCQKFISVLTKAEFLFGREGDDEDQLDSSEPPTFSAIVSLIQDALDWIGSVEVELWEHAPLLRELSGIVDDHSTPSSQVHLTQAGSVPTPYKESTESDTHSHTSHKSSTSSQRTQGHTSDQFTASQLSLLVDDEPLSGSDAEEEVRSVYSETELKQRSVGSSRSNSFSEGRSLDGSNNSGPLGYLHKEISLFIALSNEIDKWLVSIRHNSLCERLVALLAEASCRHESQTIEDFISHCFAKHSHQKVRYLMKQSQDGIGAGKLEFALSLINEVKKYDLRSVDVTHVSYDIPPPPPLSCLLPLPPSLSLRADYFN